MDESILMNDPRVGCNDEECQQVERDGVKKHRKTDKY